MVCDKLTDGYASDSPDTLTGTIQSREFRQLKQSLKKHLVNTSHTEAVNKNSSSTRLEEKEVGREKNRESFRPCCLLSA